MHNRLFGSMFSIGALRGHKLQIAEPHRRRSYHRSDGRASFIDAQASFIDAQASFIDAQASFDDRLQAQVPSPVIDETVQYLRR